MLSLRRGLQARAKAAQTAILYQQVARALNAGTIPAKDGPPRAFTAITQTRRKVLRRANFAYFWNQSELADPYSTTPLSTMASCADQCERFTRGIGRQYNGLAEASDGIGV